jgi:predicted metal-dependent HD superfamily phosphohydrolase
MGNLVMVRNPPGGSQVPVSLAERWRLVWAAVGLRAPEEVLRDLETRYVEPARFYHTLQHLTECFGHLEAARSLAGDPAAIELALWFHDAVYDPRKSDNEARSAELAEAALRRAGAPASLSRRIEEMIIATRHTAVPAPGDTALLADIDLAILGAEPGRFDEYERQIRREYSFVPEPLYVSGRAAILRGFLDRASVYTTSFFHERLEQRARDNLARSLQRLGESRWADGSAPQPT